MAALGVWNLALRVITVPFTLFTTVSRIAYPTLARVIGAGGDVRAVVERGLGTVAVGQRRRGSRRRRVRARAPRRWSAGVERPARDAAVVVRRAPARGAVVGDPQQLPVRGR
jgi:hypothetical protein